MKTFLRSLVALYFLQFLLVFDTIVSKRPWWKKLFYSVFVLVFFGWVWLMGYLQLFRGIVKDIPKSTGANALANKSILDNGVRVPTQGSSMLPTIKSGDTVIMYDPAKRGLARLDIVSVKNKETDGRYFLKRIIGMPGDLFSIQNGHVSINGKVLDEPYVLNGLPTYGNSRLLDCQQYLIPQNSYVVLGDNRTVSMDSRMLGFIDKTEIDGVIKTNIKEKYLSDSQQKAELYKTIDSKKLLDALNAIRAATESGKLRLSERLNTVASARSVVVKEQFDEWKGLKFPVEAALEKGGYRFNLAHEYVTFGYLDEASLVAQIMDSKVEREEFESGKYLDVGVGTTQRTVGACTYPVISVILGWPSNPDWDKKTIEYWRVEVQTSKENLSSLQGFVGNSSYDQTKLRRYITAEARMNDIATRLYAKVKSNQWLTHNEDAQWDEYQRLVKEVSVLDKELFADTY